MDEKNATTSVKIFVSAKELLDKMVIDRGIGKIELVSRTVEWLSNQDRTLQAIILGQVDPSDESEMFSIIRTRQDSRDDDVETLTQLLMGPATKEMSDILESLGPKYLAKVQAMGVVPAVEVAAKVQQRKKNRGPLKSA